MNKLATESSPYLLQHAGNPVNWHAWNVEALQKAVDENKLLLISIGYSACHWCHVMERECFEDKQTAAIMNDNFICIKVDREERPDVDAIYMEAVQLMTGRGGWPLNCIALPDQRPIFGGTYFPKDQWQKILLHIANLFKTDPQRCNEYANELTNGLLRSELIISTEKTTFNFKEVIKLFTGDFDKAYGGSQRVPKFPMPSNLEFLLLSVYYSGDKELTEHIKLTLKKMYYGGIFDHVEGGFSRYSTDAYWKIPHFEKMLYDNAQLVSVYSHALKFYDDPLYKQVIKKILQYVSSTLTSEEGGFYSAQDADSEGKEGKYYIWTKNEINGLLKDDAELFADYYNINDFGYWEDGNFVLIRSDDDEVIAARHNISVHQLKTVIESCISILKKEKKNRIPPGIDDKQICSWNALMLKGYTDAYTATGENEFLNAALRSADFIAEKYIKENRLFRIYKNQVSTINGTLEDYAFTINAYISLYQCTFEWKWLDLAASLLNSIKKHFYNPENGLFFFTADDGPALIARKTDVQDNVIPSGNSIMAINLFLLGKYFEDPSWISHSKSMVATMNERINTSTPWYSTWAMAALLQSKSFYEIVICGSNAKSLALEFSKLYLPGAIIAAATEENEIALFKNRFLPGETLIYICSDNSCKAPVKTIEEALGIMTKEKGVN